MKIETSTFLTAESKTVIYSIWNEVYPLRLKYEQPEDFDAYLDKLANQHHYLLIDDEETIVGWAFQFERDAETWFAILLVDAVQGRGYGTALLNEIKKRVSKLCGWVVDHSTDVKLNGEVYRSPMDFYLKNDFKIISDKRLETEKISAVKIEWIPNNITVNNE